MNKKIITVKQDISDLVVNSFSDKLSGSDIRRFQYYKWSGEETPTGIIVFSHGLIEYGKVYEEVAKSFIKAGFVVYAIDHIGHGGTVKSPKAVANWEEKSFTKCSYNLHVLINKAQTDYPNLPVFVIGNDVGYLIAFKMLSKFDTNIAGLVCSGVHGSIDSLRWLRFRARVERILHFNEKKSKHMANIINRKYNRWNIFGYNQYDWITSDESIIEKLQKDKKCNFVYTVDFYFFYFKAILKFYRKKKLKIIKDKKIPILVVGGTADAVNKFGKGVLAYSSYLKSYGFKNVKKQIYEGSRHYLFLDSSKYHLINDIINWTNDVVNK
ncbi:MAG: alpha/beta hydrolase [Erysipelotrichaceae bacterium]|nr:alpha/beta hydrolase [Erysipelotrichaceae bacterium]